MIRLYLLSLNSSVHLDGKITSVVSEMEKLESKRVNFRETFDKQRVDVMSINRELSHIEAALKQKVGYNHMLNKPSLEYKGTNIAFISSVMSLNRMCFLVRACVPCIVQAMKKELGLVLILSNLPPFPFKKGQIVFCVLDL